MRKTKVVVADNGRDAGKNFLLREWPAAKAEDWGWRAVFALNRGGSDIPIEAIANMGMAAIAYVGFSTLMRGNINSAEMIPILNELLECVSVIRDPRAVDQVSGGPVAMPISTEDDIAEVGTRLWLKSEVFELHTGFSAADVIANLISVAMASAVDQGSQEPSTSPPLSDSR